MKDQRLFSTMLRQFPRLIGIALCALLIASPALAAFSQQEDGLIVIEAENGTFSDGRNPWRVSTDISASSGGYISTQLTNWNQADSGISSYVFRVDEAEEALIYLRKRGTGKSVWISIDGETISGPVTSEAIYTPGGGWIWADGFTATKFYLSEGEHTLQLRTREANLLIDKIVIAPLNNRAITTGSNTIGPAESGNNSPSTATNTTPSVDPAPSVDPTPTVAQDSDGDGTNDTLDNCPQEAGPASNQGCPLPEPEPAPAPEPDTGTGTASTSGNADGLVILEAESGRVSSGGAQWVEASSKSNASDGSYMRTTSNVWDRDEASSLSFNFSTDNAMDAVVYLRKAGNGSSLWLSIDGTAISAIPSSQALYMPANGWLWTNGFSAAKLRLPAGQHTLQVFSRSNDMLLDKIIIAPASDRTISLGGSAIGPASDGTTTSGGETPAPTPTPTPTPAPAPTPVDPDRDGDGISDSNDACPSTHGTGSNGCPIVSSSSRTVTDFSRFSGSTNYSKPVTLPACDHNAVRINSTSDLRLLESSNKRVFCIAPGDYRSEGNNGPIIIRNKHGSASLPKVIQLDSSLGINDVIFNLAESQLALLPPLQFNNSSHWLVDRMAFIDIGQSRNRGHIAVEMHASPNIVLNRLRMEGNNGSVNFFHLSHNSVLQNSLVGHSSNVFPDNSCVSLMGGLKFVGSESNYNAPSNGASHIYNIGLYNNEFVNCNDAIMFLWDEREGSRESYIYNNPSYWSDYQGASILGNDIYIDSRLRTNCYGGLSSTGLCAKAENAIDIKAGSKNPANPVQIKDNRMWGFRKSDGFNLSDHGLAVSLHYTPARNVEISENIIWDSGAGIGITRGSSAITVHNNIVHGMFDDNGHRPIYGNTGISISAGGTEPYYGLSSDVEISYNNVIDSGGPWGLFNHVRSATIDCNVVVSNSGASTWFNSRTSTSSHVGRNSYYGGVRSSNLEPSGSVIRSSTGEARMAQACFRTGVASRSGGVTQCLSGVLSTRSSPHACSSSTWRNY